MLDKHKLKTPMGQVFHVQSEALAVAVATEWDSQHEFIKKPTMYLVSGYGCQLSLTACICGSCSAVLLQSAVLTIEVCLLWSVTNIIHNSTLSCPIISVFLRQTLWQTLIASPSTGALNTDEEWEIHTFLFLLCDGMSVAYAIMQCLTLSLCLSVCLSVHLSVSHVRVFCRNK